ncbi:MAG: radical SAM protein [Desulfobacterales bacterium]|nr:radical SAM protein [Desulfobacterales bacterium]
MTKISLIKRALVEEAAEEYALASRILERVKGVPVFRVTARDREQEPVLQDMGKETLRLVSFPGRFLKPCPGTRGYICCGYQILNVGTNCPLDCSYCILQAYFNQPSLRVFVNLDHEIAPVLNQIDQNPDRFFRIGTGEFTDSLALDPIVGWSGMLTGPCSTRRNAVLEFKTKTDRVEGLLASKGRDRIIVSWSLNSPFIASREEHGAPSIRKRLEAAKRCQAEGFALGFHFDPLIEHPGWREEYQKTLELLDRYIDPRGIIWMSLGCFRFMPALKSIIRRRHPESLVLDGEFVPALDGKMRYHKPIRIDMYGFMSEKLCQWHEDLGLYLCMEGGEVWQGGLGWTPETTEGLSRYLDQRVIRFFGPL